MHGLLLAAAGLLSLPLHVIAHPQPSTNLAGRGVDLDAYRMADRSSYMNSDDMKLKQPGIASLSGGNYVDTATEVVKRMMPGMTFRMVDDHYVGESGISHVYFRQTMHGMDIDNSDFNVNIGKDGKVLSFGHSFYTGPAPDKAPVEKRDFSDPMKAFHGACKALSLPINADKATVQTMNEHEVMFMGTSGAMSDPQGKLCYMAKEDGTLALTWRVETDMGDNWLLSYVDAKETEKVHNVVDYVSHATYQVYRRALSPDPTEGKRESIENPWNLKTSPFTWISDGKTNYTTTRGNNAIAQANFDGGEDYLNNHRPNNKNLKFEYPYAPNMSPKSYIDASVTQLFYSANMVHDLYYMLGFTEKAGNFQVNNHGQGGKGNDFVILNAQDGSGTNNANFATPPDGKPGRMRVYIWTKAKPARDSSFEAGTVIHEYTHGLSNRLTGGPANAGCLNGMESGGMGEGWGDFFATAIRLKPNDNRNANYVHGEWVNNSPKGNRMYPYSTSLQTNPLVYTSCNKYNEVHAIGTVWGSMLYEVLWNLIDKHGKNDGPTPVFENGVPKDGKYLAMKLVMDGMAIQPCKPTFVQARDAIIDADMNLTKGSNRCEIWKAFAKRGLGVGAKYDPKNRTGNKGLPKDCQ
uniref:Extracellular metalloproteinase 5 n=1 Tax=Arthroderma benhamiae TaxID=63400 RepID=MEP5_ARTBE|nr:RecName: Full=Extracellular metalloproteinase 5; AltName: Full=Fungalysin MEP5; Flags: Precursor [Trichophyton benhamiae]AAQ21096.1 metalloprotease MEP5 [Trichophyton mentagrophytes]